METFKYTLFYNITVQFYKIMVQIYNIMVQIYNIMVQNENDHLEIAIICYFRIILSFQKG